MRRSVPAVRRAVLLLIITLVGGVLSAPRAGADGGTARATWFNNAAVAAADPYVLFDRRSGYYYAYSTDGADPGWYYGIYRSPDLATWEKVGPGALPAADPKQWGRDWFWAPEVYFNARTGWYFLFYTARLAQGVREEFGHADFEEPSKIGVAVSRSPAGPFRNISDRPIDYHPYDPAYHDVNLIMDETQLRPPATHEAGLAAPTGTYLPSIDPDVYFDTDGRQYLYYSRNAYRNWVWDDDLGKYVEESNIYAVELTTDWWRDPAARTMPAVSPAYRGANAGPGGPPGPRRDGYVPVLSYAGEPQVWENGHVNDFATSGGTKKDRRWEEGSSVVKRYVTEHGRRRAVYYLTYSANNWEGPLYGVGYATASGPLGPFDKYDGNPVLSADPALPMYATGHGSFARSPDGRELYYVHHGRPAADAGPRKLYTERAGWSGRDEHGDPVLRIDASTADRPLPSGVEPLRLRASDRSVTSRLGARFPLDNPLNRVVVDRAGPDRLVLSYQRLRASGDYVTVVRRTVPA